MTVQRSSDVQALHFLIQVNCPPRWQSPQTFRNWSWEEKQSTVSPLCKSHVTCRMTGHADQSQNGYVAGLILKPLRPRLATTWKKTLLIPRRQKCSDSFHSKTLCQIHRWDRHRYRWLRTRQENRTSTTQCDCTRANRLASCLLAKSS